MTTLTLYHTALVTHIIGITLMAGTSFVNYLLTKQFWKQYAIGKAKGLAINQSLSKLTILFKIGITLLILSGVSMVAIFNGAFEEQIWFRIKMGLVIIIIINGVAIERRLSKKLSRLLAQETPNQTMEAELLKIKTKINWSQIFQIALFLIIFVLSVFKFN